MYKFLYEKNGKIESGYGKQIWEVGKTYSVKGTISCCNKGFHASPEPMQALKYVKGNILAIVRGSGDKDEQKDKSAFRSMEISHAYRWTAKDSVELAIYSAEQVINIYESEYPNDNRPRDAIKAARQYLQYPTKKSADAANAADAAAYAAADAANAVDAADAADAVDAADAADAAARAAAHAADAADAADAAARAAAHAVDAVDAVYAAYAADAAARAKITAKINSWVKKHIKKLEEVQ